MTRQYGLHNTYPAATPLPKVPRRTYTRRTAQNTPARDRVPVQGNLAGHGTGSECNRCLTKVKSSDLDDCVGCGSKDLCIDCMGGHDCEGVSVVVSRAMDVVRGGTY